MSLYTKLEVFVMLSTTWKQAWSFDAGNYKMFGPRSHGSRLEVLSELPGLPH